ncbi:TPA: hypothetical protein DIS57_01215 [Candidatus Wolfebacteria bacterium]|nr:hypothetical protein [Candidatus Wolfebacteria bacterium]
MEFILECGELRMGHNARSENGNPVAAVPGFSEWIASGDQSVGFDLLRKMLNKGVVQERGFTDGYRLCEVRMVHMQCSFGNLRQMNL